MIVRTACNVAGARRVGAVLWYYIVGQYGPLTGVGKKSISELGSVEVLRCI